LLSSGLQSLAGMIHMIGNEPHAQLPLRAAPHAIPAVAADANFDIRWAAWIAKGRVHERQVRRKLVIWAAAFAMGATILYQFVGR
jgi:hypothetical protein